LKISSAETAPRVARGKGGIDLVGQGSESRRKETTREAGHGSYVVRLRDCGPFGVDRVGTKAWNLSQLLVKGYPIPDGFVLTTQAFDRFLEENRLGTEFSSETVLAADLPDDMREACREALASLGNGSVAVRSSGVSEDLPNASFAGQYVTVLDVQGEAALARAVRACWASALSPRVAAYKVSGPQSGHPKMAVLVQQLVPADAAGVAFTANPVTGDRTEAIVSAVRGLGERLVSGEAMADEWILKGGEARRRGGIDAAITPAQAKAVAELARTVEKHFGSPQDIEWAIARDELFLLQARPMTALPDRIEWVAPLPGGWLRNFRLGEWIGDPVTPLFESWLLTRLEERLFNNFRKVVKGPVPRPPHVVVNGWYFATGNLVPTKKSAMFAMLLRHVVPALILRPRRTLMMVSPGKARKGVYAYLREWRETVLPRYRAMTEEGRARLDSSDPTALVRLVDDIADAAGDDFFSMVMVAGNAWKTELPLAAFYREHLEARIGGSHLSLLQGLGAAAPAPPAHTTIGLDWIFPTLGERNQVTDGSDVSAHWAKVVAERRATETRAREALGAQPKLIKRFDKLLEAAQRFAIIHEEHVALFTLGWPVMRRAVLRIGANLRERGLIARDEDVFFLQRDELVAGLAASSNRDFRSSVARRRQICERQRDLVPPMTLGTVSPFLKRAFDKALGTLGGSSKAEEHAVTGMAASPGRATGPARVIRRVEEFDRLQPGDILVSPATTPAWTPLFARAAAVVTDIGSLVSHASLVAREYGIPAIVGTGDATARLRDGQVVTVDGGKGTVDIDG
jgi:phosphohistidine swiveling domain-containing protein